MIDILYANVNSIRERDMDWCLECLPAAMQSEVRGYKYLHDRKSSLLARLLLYHSLAVEGRLYLLYHWKRDAWRKPFIPGWRPFNISHSGDLVVFSSCEEVIGIDIEQKKAVDFLELSTHFHWQEQAHIREAADIQEAFYDLWVKKEAALKAIGTGLSHGLKRFSCLGSRIDHLGKTWYLRPLVLDPAYTAYICTAHATADISIKKCVPDILKNLY